jgi:diadenylate cyclase
MMDQRAIIIESAVDVARKTKCGRIFLFLDTDKDCRWFERSELSNNKQLIVVIPRTLGYDHVLLSKRCAGVILNWSGNQSRFSRIKYAFLQGVLDKLITSDERVICVLGPSGKPHLDTITIHDLALSWSEEFPFDVRPLIASGFFNTIMAVIDIALDVGALGREGKSVGTIFVIGDSDAVLGISHQAVFNPFRGYSKSERMISRPEVVESLKELAKLDGAIVISSDGFVEAAGRHLDAGGKSSQKFRGLGARHRAAAGITVKTGAISVVVSESTGKVTIFQKGMTVATLEPLISRRLV